MSEFKKAVAALEPLEAELAAIQLGTSDPVSHLQRVEGLSIASEEQALLWNKFHKRAIETDEDKQVYGEKMVARVLEGWNRYQLAQSTTTELLEAAQEAAAPEIARIEQQQQFEAAATVQRQAEREACELEEETRAKEATAAAAAALERQQAEDLQTLLRREEEQREQRRAERDALEQRRAKLLMLPPAAAIRVAVTELHQTCGNIADFTAAVRTLLSLVANCVSSPDEPSYRRLRIQNANFQQEFARFDWAVECLMTAGFREQVEPSEADEAIEEQFLILAEPDPLNRFEEWKRWMSHLKTVKGVLAAVDSVLRDHRLDGSSEKFELEEPFALATKMKAQEELEATTIK